MCMYRRPANGTTFQKHQEEYLDRSHSFPQRAASFPRGTARPVNSVSQIPSHLITATGLCPLAYFANWLSQTSAYNAMMSALLTCMQACRSYPCASLVLGGFILRPTRRPSYHCDFGECNGSTDTSLNAGSEGAPAATTPLSPGLLQRMQVRLMRKACTQLSCSFCLQACSRPSCRSMYPRDVHASYL